MFHVHPLGISLIASLYYSFRRNQGSAAKSTVLSLVFLGPSLFETTQELDWFSFTPLHKSFDRPKIFRGMRVCNANRLWWTSLSLLRDDISISYALSSSDWDQAIPWSKPGCAKIKPSQIQLLCERYLASLRMIKPLVSTPQFPAKGHPDQG